MNASSTLSSDRNFSNCRVTAFFGSVRTRTRSSAVSAVSVTMTGSRPGWNAWWANGQALTLLASGDQAGYRRLAGEMAVV